jgi:hypothetical protein
MSRNEEAEEAVYVVSFNSNSLGGILSLILSSKKFFNRTSCWKVFCKFRIDDERCYCQLNVGSKLTIVLLLCLFTVISNLYI